MESEISGFFQENIQTIIILNHDELFIQHSYIFVSQCICQALQTTSEVLIRESAQNPDLIRCLVALHIAYTQIQGRLSHFARLVEVYPELVEAKNTSGLANQDGEMVSPRGRGRRSGRSMVNSTIL